MRAMAAEANDRNAGAIGGGGEVLGRQRQPTDRQLMDAVPTPPVVGLCPIRAPYNSFGVRSSYTSQR